MYVSFFVHPEKNALELASFTRNMLDSLGVVLFRSSGIKVNTKYVH